MYGDVQLQIICKSLSTVFTHQVIKGRLSIMVVLYRRAIALSAKIINKGILAVELERAITSQAAETATTSIGEMMRWFGWYGANKDDVTEEERKDAVESHPC